VSNVKQKRRRIGGRDEGGVGRRLCFEHDVGYKKKTKPSAQRGRAKYNK